MLFLRCDKNKLKKNLNIPLQEYSLCGIFETRRTAAKKKPKKEVMMVTGTERTDNHRKRYNSGSVPVITTRWN
ncbi:hypothetical protein MHI43_31315 [Paenibacillus sp. FSL H8-0457]|uniref:hypothetical protein n=1 Tax=unclassified Paenibacillus TaxID=185978 RepID=UPI00056BC51D|nr:MULTISPECIES: hypothetical protein [unclassified Paenibacillus]